MKLSHRLPTVLAAALAGFGVCCLARAAGPASSGGPSAGDESTVAQHTETIAIPGPLRSFLRMAGISQGSTPAEVLSLLARNAFLYGHEQERKTEYLVLEDRYVEQARELQTLTADGSIYITGCSDVEPRGGGGGGGGGGRKFYRPRDREASPFFKIVRDRFDEFERVYPQRFQERYGYWRPVIRSSIDKFLKCGDLREGFARVRCPDCGEEFFVAFSCRQRSCCPSCDQKRSLLLGHRLKDEVLADVPHRQWVFTIPKRLRVYFRYDRKLLGKLCRAAYDTVCEVFRMEIDGDCGLPAMVGAVQTFGDLIHWHSHIHAIVPDGVFTDSGYFVHIPDIWKHRAIEIWQEKVFDFLLDACKIDMEVVANIRGWKHSGFSVDNSVRIEAGRPSRYATPG